MRDVKRVRTRNWNYELWQTLLTAGLFIIGAIYTAAAIFQWQAMKQQAKTTDQQLNVMRADIESNKANRSAEFIFKFDEKIYKPPLSGIRLLIESDKPILKEHGGAFSTDDLDRYLDIYETMHDVYVKGLIDEEMMDSAYGHVLGKAYDNAEVKAYLSEYRKEDPDFYSGFEDLAKRMKARAHQ
jgi:hypothetical protein